jgi:hypothetical protein
MRAINLALPLCVAAASIQPSAVYAKNTLACYEEPGTRKEMCIDEAAVRVNGETRASPLFTGGPNGVRKTSYTVVVNCAKGIMTLQDQDGVNFGGNVSSATAASRSLAQWTCAVSKPRKDSKLRQF